MSDFKHDPPKTFRDAGSLDEDEARGQAEQLREAIEYHDHRYYVKNDPAVPDAAYDRLFSRLVELEERFPDIRTKSSPTRKVGAEPVDELEKTGHTEPMLSLRAVHERDDVEAFLDRLAEKLDTPSPSLMLEPKFDGLSVEVVYRDGAFDHAATRGDGETGEDISENVRTIGPVSMKLRTDDAPSFLAVRGEVYMPREGFRDVNRRLVENGGDPFANPRNAAAGTVRQLDPAKVADMPLSIVFYDILSTGDEEGPATHHEELDRLQRWGLRTDDANERADGIDGIIAYHERLAEKRDERSCGLDGIVIKLDDIAGREKLGTRERSPRWALAWKFHPKKEVTTLEDIAVQVGRTGILTPVALLDPVDVGGVTVSRATLHNAGEVKKKDVRPGDTVRVERAGDVIPEIVERVKQPGRKRGEAFSMPETCPSCGAQVYRDGAHHICPAGLSCRAQLVGHIIHYASNDAADIRGLGDETVKQLVDRDLVGNLDDLYRLRADDFLGLEGFAETSASKLEESIRDSRRLPLERFLYGLGIRHVGGHVAAVLARSFGTLDRLMDAGEADLMEIGEIGDETAGSVSRFFSEERNRRVIAAMRDLGVTVEASRSERGGALEGTTFVFTGELDDYTRPEAEETVESLGGRATSSVSGATDYVVVGDDPGQKYDDAKRLNAEIIDESAFKEMVNTSGEER